MSAGKYVRHGDTTGGVVSREYLSWANMIGRCRNPQNSRYADYGGRGITVCDRWSFFPNFLADMGRAPARFTLDRKAVDGPYEPGNCRWASRETQARNRRDSRYITVGGQTKLMVEWAEEQQVRPSVITVRLGRGWSLEAAVLVPTYVFKRGGRNVVSRANRMGAALSLNLAALHREPSPAHAG